MNIPQTLTAGDLWTWTDSLADYPASTWVLTYYFRGPEAFNVAASASGANHVVSIAASATATYKQGDYNWSAQVVSGLLKTTVGTGVLEIAPNLANLAEDSRTFNQRCLDDLKAAMANRAANPFVLSYSIAGRSQSFRDWDEIFAAYDRFRMLVAKELGLKPGRVYIRTALP